MTTAATVFRDYVVDGVPSSGAHQVVKADVRNLLAGIYTNTFLNVTGNYTVLTSDAGSAIVATGTATGTVTFGTASGYSATHFNIFWNRSSRIWNVAMTGGNTVRVWPNNCTLIANLNNSWRNSALPRYRNPGQQVVMYVDNNGVGDGLATGTGALASIAAARQVICEDVDCASVPPLIQIASGQTQAVGGGVNLTYPLTGSAQLYIQGDPSPSTGFPNRANYVVQCSSGGNCFFGREPSTTTLQGMKLQSADGTGVAIAATQFSTIDLNGVDFSKFGQGVNCDKASVNMLPNTEFAGRTYDYKILGDQTSEHIVCSNNGYVNYGSLTVNIPGAIAFVFFVAAASGGRISAAGVPTTFTGTGAGAGSTGARYQVTPPGQLDKAGTTYPGNSAGSVAAAVYDS